jgi:molybdate transport system regulatory protein
VDERIGVQRNRTGTRASIQTAIGNIVSARVKTKIWLELDGRFAVGDGGLRLLREIAATGSLAAAVREIGWSYRHAWGYIRRAEAVLGVPLIVARPGKGAARGTELTADGRLLLDRLVALRQRVDDTVGIDLHGGPEMAPKPPNARSAPAKPWRSSRYS